MAAVADFPVKVFGFTTHIENLMNASDVMVTKLGGLTTFEALASRLPIIADTTTEPMPQEAQTAELIARHQAGVLLKQAQDVVPFVRNLLHDPAQHAAMRLAAARIAIPDATQRIVKELMVKIEERATLAPHKAENQVAA